MSDTAANWWGAALLYLTIFGTLKIINVITLSWLWIFSPFWGSAILFVASLLLAVWMISNKGKGDWSE
jgi:hypothetical protein